MHLFTCTLNKCSSNASCMPGTVLGPGDPMVSKTNRVPSFMELIF